MTKLINPKIDLEKIIAEAKFSLQTKGYYVAKDLLEVDGYKTAREEGIAFFKQAVQSKNRLPYSLRGNIGGGMRDVLGYCDNKTWKLYRNCSFTWNKTDHRIKTIVDISRQLSRLRNILNEDPPDLGLLIEDDGYSAYTSLSLYPSDGGFLKIHQDGLEYSDNTHKQGPILHFKVELTHKVKDYAEGGFSLFDRSKGEMVNLSDMIEEKDVLFFDGRQPHQVNRTSGGSLGRIAFFEIPTYVAPESRISLYTGDGWPRFKTIAMVLANRSLCKAKQVISTIAGSRG